MLALWDAPGVVRLLQTATGKELARLTSLEQTRLVPRHFTPDGSQLITVGQETGALHLFDLRAIRQGLRELGLDWSDEPLPPAPAPTVKPLEIRVEMGNFREQIRADELVEEAARHVQNREHARALAALELAVQTDPTHAEAHRYLARRLLVGPRELRDADRALPLARKALELVDKENSLRHVYDRTLGIALYRTGQYSDAVPILETSLKKSNGQSDAFDLYFLAMCHQRLHEGGKAKDRYDQAQKWFRERRDGLLAGWIQDLNELQAEAEAELRTP
jgi:tetratricopeptide (TPR) repeat protein